MRLLSAVFVFMSMINGCYGASFSLELEEVNTKIFLKARSIIGFPAYDFKSMQTIILRNGPDFSSYSGPIDYYNLSFGGAVQTGKFRLRNIARKQTELVGAVDFKEKLAFASYYGTGPTDEERVIFTYNKINGQVSKFPIDIFPLPNPDHLCFSVEKAHKNNLAIVYGLDHAAYLKFFDVLNSSFSRPIALDSKLFKTACDGQFASLSNGNIVVFSDRIGVTQYPYNRTSILYAIYAKNGAIVAPPKPIDRPAPHEVAFSVTGPSFSSVSIRDGFGVFYVVRNSSDEKSLRYQRYSSTGVREGSERVIVPFGLEDMRPDGVYDVYKLSDELMVVYFSTDNNRYLQLVSSNGDLRSSVLAIPNHFIGTAVKASPRSLMLFGASLHGMYNHVPGIYRLRIVQH